MSPGLKDHIDDQILEMRERRLTSLKAGMKSGKTALVMGAGVSASVGLPTWSELLSICFGRALAAGMIRKKTNDGTRRGSLTDNPYLTANSKYKSKNRLLNGRLYKSLMTRGGVSSPLDANPLETGQYFYQALETLLEQYEFRSATIQDEMFKQLISEGLRFSGELEDLKGKRDTTLAKCAELFSSGRVRHAITYNFDTMFESYLYAVEGKKIGTDYRVYLDEPTERKSDNRRDLYHIHGCIPNWRDPVVPGVRESAGVVFAEQRYYEIERFPYDWINMIQADFLYRYTCVFVGFSAEDYNFRRIMKLTPGRQAWNHYLFITLDGQIKNCRRSFGERHAQLVSDVKAAVEHEAIRLLRENASARTSAAELLRRAVDEERRKAGSEDKELEKLAREAAPEKSPAGACEAAEQAERALEAWLALRADDDRMSERVLLNYYMELKENYWSRYGMFPIWTTIDELPSILGGL